MSSLLEKRVRVQRSGIDTIHVISDVSTKIFCRLNFFQKFGKVEDSQKEFVCDADAVSLS